MSSRLLRSGALALTLTLSVGAPAFAQKEISVEDSIARSREPLFTQKDAWIGAGFVVATVAARPLDNYFAERLTDLASKENRFLDRSFDFFEWMGSPGPFYIGPAVYALGKVTRKREIADLGLHGTEALWIGMGMVGVLKGAVGRARPYVEPRDPVNYKFGRGWNKDEYRSFPSGHSLAGFAAASAVTAEAGRWWPKYQWLVGIAMYGGAAGIASSRMYHNKHWASDVIVGAAIGTFAGRKVVRWHHSHPDNRLDRWLLGTAVTPDETRLGITYMLPR